MKIAIISAVAPPEPGVSGRVNWDIALDLSEKGNEVVFISPYPSRPVSMFGKLSSKSNKVQVISSTFIHVNVNSFTYPDYGLLGRSYESVDFALKAMRFLIKKHRNIDIIYATPWPFLGQLLVSVLARIYRIPLIMNVQDLYPEAFFNKIKSRKLKGILQPLKHIDRLIVKYSTHITTVSDSIKNIYLQERGIRANKITVIENWQDESLFIKFKCERKALIEKYALKDFADCIIFMYLGNIGPAAGVGNIISAFSELKRDNVCLVIAGSGTERNSCMELASNLKMTNVVFVSVPQGLESVVELQSISDVLLLPVVKDAAKSSIPSKMIAYMFSCKPILSSAELDSYTGNAIITSACGLLVDDNNSWIQQMEAVLDISSDERQQMGQRGFDFAINRFSKTKGLEKINNLIINFE